MALQDLTPQLRIRLGRVERTVGVFVLVAALLLIAGFGYYLWHTAQRKGWFLTKAPYFIYVQSAAGLNLGDPVKLMGFDAGEITKITAESPEKHENVYLEFSIKEPYYGYLWSEGSQARITAADFLGKRSLEVTKGTAGRATYRVENGVITGKWKQEAKDYVPFNPREPFWLVVDEAPALTERLEAVATKVEAALPNILGLTNQISSLLTNSTLAAAKIDALVAEARPAVADARTLLAGLQPVATNAAAITAQLRDQKGALGEMLLPTNLHAQLALTLSNANATLLTANSTVAHMDTNLAQIVASLGRSLENLANLTSNLNSQVQANTNILTEISAAITHTDGLVQGLKSHWLLRSSFKTNAPPAKAVPPKKR